MFTAGVCGSGWLRAERLVVRKMRFHGRNQLHHRKQGVEGGRGRDEGREGGRGRKGWALRRVLTPYRDCLSESQ